MGGRLQFFSASWGEICQDKFILDMVPHGYRLELVVTYPARFLMTDLPRITELGSGIVLTIQDLVEQGAEVAVPPE